MRRSARSLCVAAATTAALERLVTGHDGTFGVRSLERVAFDTSLVAARQGTSGPELVFPFTVTEAVCDHDGNIAPGALLALADLFTTAHLWGSHPGATHVSADFAFQHLRPAPVGAALRCVTVAPRVGRSLGFTQYAFEDARSGAVLARGSHTKAMLAKKK